MPELLAPAGDFEKLEFAYLYGADAVYFGGQNFSLRANAKNFSLEDIKKATEYAHSLGKKVYVTVNIVFHNKDFDGLDEYLKYLDSINVDGIIAGISGKVDGTADFISGHGSVADGEGVVVCCSSDGGGIILLPVNHFNGVQGTVRDSRILDIHHVMAGVIVSCRNGRRGINAGAVQQIQPVVIEGAGRGISVIQAKSAFGGIHIPVNGSFV